MIQNELHSYGAQIFVVITLNICFLRISGTSFAKIEESSSLGVIPLYKYVKRKFVINNRGLALSFQGSPIPGEPLERSMIEKSVLIFYLGRYGIAFMISDKDWN